MNENKEADAVGGVGGVENLSQPQEVSREGNGDIELRLDVENEKAEEAQPSFEQVTSPSSVDDQKVVHDKPKLFAKLFGSKRKLIAWGIGLGVVLVAIVGGLFLKSYFEEQAELRESATSSYEAGKADFNGKFKVLQTARGEAQNLLDTTEATEVMDSSVLDDLEQALERAIGFGADPDVLTGVTKLSIEEIDKATKTLLSDSSQTVDITEEINDAAGAVEESKTKKSAEVAAAAKKAKIDAAGPISYVDLARGGDSLIGNYYWFEGEIIQDAGGGTYRVSITKDPGYSMVFWKDPILVSIIGETSQKILEDDVISFLGSSLGVQSYESIFGQEITLPLVAVEGGNVTVTGRSG